MNASDLKEIDDTYSLPDNFIVLDDGRVLSPDGEELFTAYFIPTVGQLHLVRSFSRNHLRKSYQGSIRTSASTVSYDLQKRSRRAQKNRVNLVNYNVHNRLRIAGTLTMSDWPNGPIPPLQMFITGLRIYLGRRFPWSGVAEMGNNGQPHWHLCLPEYFDHEMLRGCWEPMSVTDFQYLETPTDLMRWSRYMGKTFDLSRFERPTHRRFHSGPGFGPKPIKHEFISKTEALRLVQEQARIAGSEIVEWDGPDAWCAKAYFWKVEI